MIKLTKRNVDALTPRQKQYVEYDTDLTGFGVAVYASRHQVMDLRVSATWRRSERREKAGDARQGHSIDGGTGA